MRGKLSGGVQSQQRKRREETVSDSPVRSHLPPGPCLSAHHFQQAQPDEAAYLIQHAVRTDRQATRRNGHRLFTSQERLQITQLARVGQARGGSRIMNRFPATLHPVFR